MSGVKFRNSKLRNSISKMKEACRKLNTKEEYGILKETKGQLITVTLPGACIGDLCELINPNSSEIMLAEVISVQEENAILSPYGTTAGLSSRTRVLTTGEPLMVPVGQKLLGSILNAFGQPLSGEKFDKSDMAFRPVRTSSPSPVDRPLIKDVFATGIRAIDGLITLGKGQRVGVFGEPGAGKSVLLSMIAQKAEADVCVLALIGERGREVREFLDRQLPQEFRQNCVVVVSTSDRPSMERVIGAYTATTIAEYFRDKGHSVLLLMDSITRYARALREVGLAAGEPPARKGFPPSVLSEMPLLIERSGGTMEGSITAIYTVLMEADSLGDPVSEELRSLADGHIVLDYSIAQAGHYPAIDVLASKSRIMDEVVSEEHKQNSREIRKLMSKYKDIELLLQLGEYRVGSDALADSAIQRKELIDNFLQQSSEDFDEFSDIVPKLREIVF